MRPSIFAFRLDNPIMGEAVGFPAAPLTVSVKIVLWPTKWVVASYLFNSAKNRSEGLTQAKLLRGLRILGIHEHHKVRVFRKERDLASRVSPISAVRVGLDEFAYSQAVRGCFKGDGHVFISSPFHSIGSSRFEDRSWFQKCLGPVLTIFPADTGLLKSAPGRAWDRRSCR